jgi:hypothetical protein
VIKFSKTADESIDVKGPKNVPQSHQRLSIAEHIFEYCSTGPYGTVLFILSFSVRDLIS